MIKETKKSPSNLGILISSTENLKNQKWQKMFFERYYEKFIEKIFSFLGKSHNAEKTKSGQLSQK